MVKRTHWIPHFTTGNARLDEQHQELLAQCNALASCLEEAGEAARERFSVILKDLLTGVREHFTTENQLLARHGYPLLDQHAHEGEEFEYLATEIISTEHFDMDELQTFLALWCTGHIVGTAGPQRPYLEQAAAS